MMHAPEQVPSLCHFPTTLGVEGDWLENADSTCVTLIMQRRWEIMQIYRNGTLDHSAKVCSRQVTGGGSATTGCVACLPGCVQKSLQLF